MGLFVALAGGVAVGRRRFEREVRGHVDDLLGDAARSTGGEFTAADLDGLPTPVRRYFETVVDERRPSVRIARLSQRGAFRLGGPDASWHPLEATQVFSATPPAFVWDARIDVAPLFPVRVVDRYGRGDGVLQAKLWAALPVASAGPSPEMDESELVRYLAETVWFPTALLPANGVSWAGIDARTARATLEHRGRTASLTFHFDESNLVERVTTERYRQEDDAYVPWTGYFSDYETHDGLRVPTVAAVEWNLPADDLSYWRATLDDVSYRPSG
ncbi:MAG: DUF6544 family protein [Haloarculaceae archaeon]